MSRPLRLLLVEDSANDAEMIVRALEIGGYAVTYERVETPEAMQAALAQSRWDLVLSDYRLPRFSAPAALAVLQSASLDIPFIIISGTIGEETAVSALKAGANDFLVKGRLARLIPAVERELREVAQRRERVEAQQALRDSEMQYRTLVEHAVFGIYQATIDGQFLGYESAEEVIEVGLGNLYPDPSTSPEFVRRLIKQGRFTGAETIWRRKTGDEIRVRLNGRLTQGPDAPTPVFEVIVEDITEQHRLHEQLRQAQKMEAVGQLAGGVAHDFNNMLTAILGYTELLTGQIGPDKLIGQDLREIQKAAERAASLTRQLLAFSRKQLLAIKVVDLSAVVRDLEPMLRRLLGEPVRIETRLGEALVPVMADVMQLEHLLINLSVNARDAMPQGGVLTLATGNVTLDKAFVRAHPGAVTGSHAALSVIDTGIGMTPEIRARIFEPFFTTKEIGRGTGLGLAAVYGTVKQLGGYIGVESEPGRGATFTIYLPETRQHAPGTGPSGPSVPPVGEETILLVEDEHGVRAFAKIALERFGYRVLEADSSEAALALLADLDRPIHLLLTDVVLPGMDGRELAVRLSVTRPNLRILFMSGYASELRTTDGYLIQGVQLLEKPFTAQALLAKTRQMLDVTGSPMEI
jgi:PAS domain S-box-containing protein